MLAWVIDVARASGVGPVAVASEADHVLEEARRLGVEAVKTSARHSTGSERVAEAVRLLAPNPETLIVNLQGDEPLMPPGILLACVRALELEPSWAMATPAVALHDAADYRNHNVVKVVTDLKGTASYFSRAPIPWNRDAGGERPPPAGALRHLGLYVYRPEALFVWAETPPAPAEEAEKLEQLRALWAGLTVGVVTVTETPPGPAVDTPDDARRVEAILSARICPSPE